MGVDKDGDIDLLLEGRHQVIALLGAHDAGHVLDAQGLAAHGGDLLAQLDVEGKVVDGGEGVADGALGLGSGGEAGLHRRLDIAHIVQRVEDADDVDAVFDGRGDKAADGVVRIVVVAQDVLPAQQHLEFGVLHVGLDGAQPFPRVLVQIAQAGVKGGPAPALDRVIAGLIHRVQDVDEVRGGHTGRHQRLLGVAQHRLGDVKLSHKVSTSLLYWNAEYGGTRSTGPYGAFVKIIAICGKKINAF